MAQHTVSAAAATTGNGQPHRRIVAPDVAPREGPQRPTTKVVKAADLPRILGQGTLATSGLPFVLVSSSSEPGRVHVVAYAYEGVSRIICDCRAASFGRTCKHVLVALEWLAAYERKQRDEAPLRRSNAPFSIWK